jgi:hypothetical protein
MPLLGFVHLLLNLVGLLLWLRWREEMLHFSRRATGGTLLATLRKASSTASSRWTWLGCLLGLLILRAVGYWHIGAAVRWAPFLDLGALVIIFRSDLLSRMLVFSFCSQAAFVAGFYCWLLFLSALNRRVSDAEPVQNRVRAHLGWMERWPAFLKLLTPFLLAAFLWLGLGPLLAKLDFILPARSPNHILQQALVVGLASFLVWKYLLVGLLLLHLLATYVYLGHSPFWTFINLTGRNLLRPLSWIPWRVGRVDPAPLVGAALILFLAELAYRSLPSLYQRLPLW